MLIKILREKERNSIKQQFLLFTQCFQYIHGQIYQWINKKKNDLSSIIVGCENTILFFSPKKEMVMGLSERTAKEVLCCAAEAMPSLIINITEKYEDEASAGGPAPGPGPAPEPGPPPSNLSWCICNNCKETIPEDVQVSCGFGPDLCQSIIPVSMNLSFANLTLYPKIIRCTSFRRYNRLLLWNHRTTLEEGGCTAESS